jgi:hypothetical protein
MTKQKSPHSVLTPEDVLDIYELAWSGDNQTQIAKDYAVSQATVSGIKLGYYWNEVTGHERHRPLTPRQERIMDIYSAYWDSKRTVPDIAAEYGVSLSTVYDIRRGLVGARVTGHPTTPKIRKKVSA